MDFYVKESIISVFLLSLNSLLFLNIELRSIILSGLMDIAYSLFYVGFLVVKERDFIFAGIYVYWINIGV